jgi:hypothetical protein
MTIICARRAAFRGAIMDSSRSGTKSSMANFFHSIKDRVFNAEAAPAVDKKNMNLAQKQANIRAACVRAGFQAIRARNAEMAQRIEQYKRQRKKTDSAAESPADAADQMETIVLSSNL